MKTCPRCNTKKPLDAFAKNKDTKSGLCSWCKACTSAYAKALRAKYPDRHKRAIRNWTVRNREKVRQLSREKYHRNPEKEKARHREFIAANPDYPREWRLINCYGITLAQYNEILAKQGGKCAICRSDSPGRKFKHLLVDHFHDTGAVRGLLCNDCNLVLGHAKDSIDVLKAAIQYLEDI